MRSPAEIASQNSTAERYFAEHMAGKPFFKKTHNHVKKLETAFYVLL